MKIGIVSDTHRNKENLDKVAVFLKTRQRIEVLYHLGDDYEDLIGLDDQHIDIVQIPGIYHQKYRDGSLKPKVIENHHGLRIMLIHSVDKDFTYEDRATCDIVLHGHTHHPEIKIDRGILFVNPGHLKSNLDKNVKPSFAVMDLKDDSLHVNIFDLDFKIIEDVEVLRSGSGLYKS